MCTSISRANCQEHVHNTPRRTQRSTGTAITWALLSEIRDQIITAFCSSSAFLWPSALERLLGDGTFLRVLRGEMFWTYFPQGVAIRWARVVHDRITRKNLSPEILLHVSQTLNIPMRGLVAVIELLDEGGTVPFIARYRKEATGNLDEVQVRDIEEKLSYFRELQSRRETILASIAEQGKLTDELKARIEGVLDKSELEDLYLPYKPKRRTKATIARDKGLEPLAKYLWNQQAQAEPLVTLAAGFVNEEKGVANVEEALEGARHIVAEMISEDADLRKALRQLMFDEGVVVSRKATDAVDEQEKFKMYYEYREPVKTIPSHRMLAIRRGENEKVLYFLLELESERALGVLRSRVLRPEGDWTPQLEMAIDDSWQRLLNSSIQGEIRLELKKRSDLDAIQVFRENLHELLLCAAGWADLGAGH